MALIKCPECGHMISEYASACISCGCPMDTIKGLLKKNETNTIIPSGNKFLSSIDKETMRFISDFTNKLNEKYSGKFDTKENNKSFMYKFHSYEKLLLQFKLIKSSGELKLEYKTSGKKRRLMPHSSGKYNIEKTTSKLFPILDDYFDKTSIPKQKEKLIKNTQKKETKKDVKKILPTKPKKIKLTLSERLSTLQKQVLQMISNYIENSYPDYETLLTSYHFVIRKKDTPYSMIWYCLVDNEIVIKYRTDDKISSEVKIYQGNPFRIDYVKEFIELILGTPSKAIDNLSDNAKETEKKINRFTAPIEKHLEFYKNIKRAVRGNPIKSQNKKVIDLCNSVANFVINELKPTCYNQKTEMWTRGNFFGYSVFIPFFDERDAYEVFKYYKAAAVIGEIKKYESNLNKQIITNQFELLIDIYSMIEDEEINYSRARGLNSNFGIFVPEHILDSCVEDLDKISEM